MADRIVDALLDALSQAPHAQSPDLHYLLQRLLDDLDARLARHLDAIVHHPAFQRLEAAWRGLAFVVDRIPEGQGIEVSFLSCTREELDADLRRGVDVEDTALHCLLVDDPLLAPGGAPYGAILCDLAFGPSEAEVALLARCAEVAHRAQVPWIAMAAPALIGLDRWSDLAAHEHALEVAFDGPSHAAYRAFRNTEDAGYVALLLPRFLLRPRHVVAGEPLAYEEQIAPDGAAGLWGSAGYAFAVCLGESFAQTRTCAHCVPPTGGTLLDLPCHDVCTNAPSPTEHPISPPLAASLAWLGLVALTAERDAQSARFLSAPSCSTHFRLEDAGRTLPFDPVLQWIPCLLFATRFAHYLHVLRRDGCAAAADVVDVEHALGAWLGGCAADARVPPPRYRSRHPVRAARLYFGPERQYDLFMRVQSSQVPGTPWGLLPVLLWGVFPRRSGTAPRSSPALGAPLPDAPAVPVVAMRTDLFGRAAPVLSPDGRWAATLEGGAVWVWDVAARTPLRVLPGQGRKFVGVAWRADGGALAGLDTRGVLLVWDLRTGGEETFIVGRSPFCGAGFELTRGILTPTGGAGGLRSAEAEASLDWAPPGGDAMSKDPVAAFTPDGSALVLASGDGTIRLLDTQTWLPHAARPASNAPCWVEFDRDRGEILLGHSGDRSVSWWAEDLTGPEGTLEIAGRGSLLGAGPGVILGCSRADEGEEPYTLTVTDRATGAARMLAADVEHIGPIAVHGTTLAHGVTRGAVALLDLTTGASLGRLDGHFSTSLAFSGDGHLLAMGAGVIRVWDWANRRQVALLTGCPSTVSRLAMAADGRRIAGVCSDDAVVRIWDVGAGGTGTAARGHGDWILSLSFHPDGTLLASSSHDGTARLWDPATGRCLALLFPYRGGFGIAAPDGRYRLQGHPGGVFWHASGLRRLEAGGADGALTQSLRVPDDAPFAIDHAPPQHG